MSELQGALIVLLSTGALGLITYAWFRALR